MAVFEARKASLIIEVANLLKQNGKLLEVRKKGKVEVDTLKKEFSEVKKSLKEAKLKPVNLESLREKMDELKGQAEGLET